MAKIFAFVTSAMGVLVAAVSTGGCAIVWYDEPEMPASLIK